MIKTRTGLMALALAMGSAWAMAQTSPVGLWKTIDDKSGKERSLVRIVDTAGVVSGRIEKLLAADAKPDSMCDKCADDRKDKPIVGLEIIRGVKKGDEHWEGGTILDPNDGKVYKVRLKPEDGGKKLEVRGYIGFFFRNQHWIRVE